MKHTLLSFAVLAMAVIAFITMVGGAFLPSRGWIAGSVAVTALGGIPLAKYFVARQVQKKRSPLYGAATATSAWMVVGIPILLVSYGFSLYTVGAAITVAFGEVHQRRGHISSWGTSRRGRGPDCATVRAMIEREPRNLHVTLCLAGAYGASGFTGHHYFSVIESAFGDVVAPPR